MPTQSFEVKDVKTLNPEALGRAIGRIAGKNGGMKLAIESATKTRIVLADSRIHSASLSLPVSGFLVH